MKKLNAISRVALGLVSLAAALVLLFDLAFGLLPSDSENLRQMRQRVSEHLAIQVAALLNDRDGAALRNTLEAVRLRDPEMRSVAVRRADGLIAASSGEHLRHWAGRGEVASSLTHVLVPIQAGGVRWGGLELVYRSPLERPLADWFAGPTARLVALLMVGGFVLFYLYLRKVLQHLDPSAAVPDRVRVAFDTLTEGVAIVDANGRIVLSNAGFRRLAGQENRDPIGRKPGELPWLAAAIEADEGEPAWVEAMRTARTVSGRALAIERPNGGARKVIVNCAPVLDPSGSAQGCMITFNDVTQLEQAREQLVDALADLVTSKEELERKNDELERLASRDPLTGCLNRRAFFEAFERQFRAAAAGGTRLACVMADIDKFKSINDRFGHQTGDQVIQHFAAALQASARPGDLVGRYGGEEFCLVVSGQSHAAVTRLVEQLRARFEAGCAPSIPALFGSSVTASFGVSLIEWGSGTPAEFVDQADQALYFAKQNGRNRVVDFAAIPAGAKVVDHA